MMFLSFHFYEYFLCRSLRPQWNLIGQINIALVFVCCVVFCIQWWQKCYLILIFCLRVVCSVVLSYTCILIFLLVCYFCIFLMFYVSHSLNRENSRLAAEVYKDMPETSFTRTISNPEVVMKRRRQQKLEKRMQEFRSGDGRPDSGVWLNTQC